MKYVLSIVSLTFSFVTLAHVTHIWVLLVVLCKNDQYQHFLHLLTSRLQVIVERPRHRWLVLYRGNVCGGEVPPYAEPLGHC